MIRSRAKKRYRAKKKNPSKTVIINKFIDIRQIKSSKSYENCTIHNASRFELPEPIFYSWFKNCTFTGSKSNFSFAECLFKDCGILTPKIINNSHIAINLYFNCRFEIDLLDIRISREKEMDTPILNKFFKNNIGIANEYNFSYYGYGQFNLRHLKPKPLKIPTKMWILSKAILKSAIAISGNEYYKIKHPHISI